MCPPTRLVLPAAPSVVLCLPPRFLHTDSARPSWSSTGGRSPTDSARFIVLLFLLVLPSRAGVSFPPTCPLGASSLVVSSKLGMSSLTSYNRVYTHVLILPPTDWVGEIRQFKNVEFPISSSFDKSLPFTFTTIRTPIKIKTISAYTYIISLLH